jgi:hypothetical protein
MIPGGRGMGTAKRVEEGGQPLVAVSRPGSVRSLSVKVKVGADDEETDSEGSEEEKEGEYEEDGPQAEQHESGGGDARSIRSFENMMSNAKRERKSAGSGARRSLTDRLANVSSLAGLKVRNIKLMNICT